MAGGGRPSIDPIVFFKLQLVMFFEGIRSERQLMRHAADRLSVRWYIAYDLGEPLPDHSSLTRIREVIETITSKVVLILGRFTSERKAVLDALRAALRFKTPASQRHHMSSDKQVSFRKDFCLWKPCSQAMYGRANFHLLLWRRGDIMLRHTGPIVHSFIARA
jgi:hypothetical protein